MGGMGLEGELYIAKIIQFAGVAESPHALNGGVTWHETLLEGFYL